MPARALYSKATISGTPIHVMLVGFPIAAYVGGMVALLAHAATRDVFWFRGAMLLWFAGVVLALIAALFGFVDLFFGLPRESKAHRRGIRHMGLNLLGTVLFAGATLALYMEWNALVPLVPPDIALPIALGAIGLVVTFAAATFGMRIISAHHVGVDEPRYTSPQLPSSHASSHAGPFEAPRPATMHP